MTESELYQNFIKKFLTSRGYFFYRIDYPRVPDIYTAKEGKVLWLELKCKCRMKDGFIYPDWRPGQLAWIKEHKEKGGNLIRLVFYYDGDIYFLYPKECYTITELLNTEKQEDYNGTRIFI